jgi:hypothetical protein
MFYLQKTLTRKKRKHGATFTSFTMIAVIEILYIITGSKKKLSCKIFTLGTIYAHRHHVLADVTPTALVSVRSLSTCPFTLHSY